MKHIISIIIIFPLYIPLYLYVIYTLGGSIEFKISSVYAFVIDYGAASLPFFLSLIGFPDVDTSVALAYLTSEFGAGIFGLSDIIIK
jgi:hypothetical protein